MQSDCYLVSSPECTEEGQRRLDILCQSRDGFFIAQKDLEMRGGGLISGQEQTGRPVFRHGDPFRDQNVFEQARQDVAKEITLDLPPDELRPIIRDVERRHDEISFS